MERFIQKIVKEAGDAVLARFGKEGVHRTKAHKRWDVVTKADLLSERMMISAIREAYPEHGIISEESGKIGEGSEHVWILDPIDGTLNYSLGVPMFGIMACLARRGDPILSAIYMPATQECFFAKAGKGAYRNGKRIHCSSAASLDTSFGMHGAKMDPRTVKFLKNALRFAKGKHVLLGSFSGPANACYVAAGRRDWIVGLSGEVWDFAPEFLVLKEAGCNVTDAKGRPWKFGTPEMIAANPTLHKQLLRLTKNV